MRFMVVSFRDPHREALEGATYGGEAHVTASDGVETIRRRIGEEAHCDGDFSRPLTVGVS